MPIFENREMRRIHLNYRDAGGSIREKRIESADLDRDPPRPTEFTLSEAELRDIMADERARTVFEGLLEAGDSGKANVGIMLKQKTRAARSLLADVLSPPPETPDGVPAGTTSKRMAAKKAAKTEAS